MTRLRLLLGNPSIRLIAWDELIIFVSIRQEYLDERPHETFTFLKLDIPCDDDCLKGTKFHELLNNQRVAEALEVIRYMKMLIDSKTKELLDLVADRLTALGSPVRPEDWAYSVYWKLQGRGEVTVGHGLYYDNVKLFEGEFQEVLRAGKLFESLLTDPQIREVCVEIKNLSDSLWTHFEKNVKRAVEES